MGFALRQLPGLTGALLAYAVVSLGGWAMGPVTELAVYLGTFLVGSIAMDVAMRRYGRGS